MAQAWQGHAAVCKQVCVCTCILLSLHIQLHVCAHVCSCVHLHALCHCMHAYVRMRPQDQTNHSAPNCSRYGVRYPEDGDVEDFTFEELAKYLVPITATS